MHSNKTLFLKKKKQRSDFQPLFPNMEVILIKLIIPQNNFFTYTIQTNSRNFLLLKINLKTK